VNWPTGEFVRVRASLGAFVVTLAAIAGCRTAESPRVVTPGAPGEASRVGDATKPDRPKPTGADVAFMTGMIPHHTQALEMVTILESRTSNDAMRMLGLRIKVSQEDEIRLMQTWLRDHGLPVPDEHAHHSENPMPGMLTAEEMRKLAATTGVAFDKLFLELMIRHHEGAVRMVDALMATPGAAQMSSVYAFAADVLADQTAEITRMRAMRAAMGK
jgi:uncharacterized protein (DUF305 family)